MTSRVYDSEVEERRDIDRPYTRWVDGIRKARSAKSLKLYDANLICMGKKQRGGFVNTTNGGVNVKGMTENVFDATL